MEGRPSDVSVSIGPSDRPTGLIPRESPVPRLFRTGATAAMQGY
jgi:hypothetical protein